MTRLQFCEAGLPSRKRTRNRSSRRRGLLRRNTPGRCQRSCDCVRHLNLATCGRVAQEHHTLREAENRSPSHEIRMPSFSTCSVSHLRGPATIRSGSPSLRGRPPGRQWLRTLLLLGRIQARPVRQLESAFARPLCSGPREITSTVTSRCASGRRSASDVFNPCEVGTAVPPARLILLLSVGHPGLRDLRS